MLNFEAIPLPPELKDTPKVEVVPTLAVVIPKAVPHYITEPTLTKRYTFKEALIGARKFIASGKADYICLAMPDFAIDDFFGYVVSDEVWMRYHAEACYVMKKHVERVEKLIAPFHNYIRWLEDALGEDVHNPRMSRLKWIDELIEKET